MRMLYRALFIFILCAAPQMSAASSDPILAGRLRSALRERRNWSGIWVGKTAGAITWWAKTEIFDRPLRLTLTCDYGRGIVRHEATSEGQVSPERQRCLSLCLWPRYYTRMLSQTVDGPAIRIATNQQRQQDELRRTTAGVFRENLRRERLGVLIRVIAMLGRPYPGHPEVTNHYQIDPDGTMHADVSNSFRMYSRLTDAIFRRQLRRAAEAGFDVAAVPRRWAVPIDGSERGTLQLVHFSE